MTELERLKEIITGLVNELDTRYKVYEMLQLTCETIQKEIFRGEMIDCRFFHRDEAQVPSIIRLNEYLPRYLNKEIAEKRNTTLERVKYMEFHKNGRKQSSLCASFLNPDPESLSKIKNIYLKNELNENDVTKFEYDILRFYSGYQNTDISNKINTANGILVVPMLVKSRCIGVLIAVCGAGHNPTEVFTAENVKDISAILERVAPLVERTWTLELISQLALFRNPTTPDNIKERLETVIDFAMELTNADSGYILALGSQADSSRSKQEEYSVRSIYKLPEQSGEGEPIVDTKLENRLAKETQKLIYSSEGRQVKVIKHRFSALNYRFSAQPIMMATLLTSNGDILGSMFLLSKTKSDFNDVEKSAFSLFANEAAKFIRNNEYYRKVKQLSELLVATDNIVRSPPSKILRHVVTATKSAFSNSFICIIPLSPNTNSANEETTKSIAYSPRVDAIETSEIALKQSQINELKLVTSVNDYLQELQPYYIVDPKYRNLSLTFTSGKRLDKKYIDDVNKVMEKKYFGAFCVSLSLTETGEAEIAGQPIFGVMWIFFEDENVFYTTLNDIQVLLLYSNIITIAYEQAQKRLEVARKDYSNDLEKFTGAINQEHNFQIRISRIISWLGLTVVIGIIILVLFDMLGIINTNIEIEFALFIGFLGTISQFLGTLVLNRTEQAINRFDKIRNDLFQIHLLDVLLVSSRQLNNDQEKSSLVQQILNQAAQSWFNDRIE